MEGWSVSQTQAPLLHVPLHWWLSPLGGKAQEDATTESGHIHRKFSSTSQSTNLVLWILTGGVSGSLKPEVSGEGPPSEKGLVVQLVRSSSACLQGWTLGVLGVGPIVFFSGLVGYREIPGSQPGAGKEAECQGAGTGATQSEAEEGRSSRSLCGPSALPGHLASASRPSPSIHGFLTCPEKTCVPACVFI